MLNKSEYSLTGIVPTEKIEGTINTLSHREAMGLTEDYCDSELDDLSEEYRHYITCDTESLISVAESLSVVFKERFVAGTILALRGDPRISVLNPKMLTVDGGTCVLGLPEKDVDKVYREFRHIGVNRDWIEKESPTYQVTLPTYRLAKYCVTNQEYRTFLSETGANFIPSSWLFGRFPNEKSNHPVHSVSVSGINNYISWLNKKTRRNFRLPTEAEWEHAAAGLARYEYPWGNGYQKDHANTIEAGIMQSTTVGIFPKGVGPYGHMDLAGNVEEYVSDLYKPYPDGKFINDDLVEKVGTYQIARGGSFTRFRDLSRTRRRHGDYGSDIYVMGFRLAESL
ncbi:formylglycine-generating enzyme family protein [Exilibacterium tricleocarpae]|uniref:Formylglycine-generating enzyme family protein n=1 Tax=Exilibacterium tricleocarpae TaxID=2591008 RepID=A0A545SRR8_9GAMM|nr:SUMF1/EgtB/PvdO family nonheme iron enzyme [Exilibacterium tricleocarpae]TQV67662.1 formylglycine-generating enzyme family protein [Exilibacterium tricleocarpae]